MTTPTLSLITFCYPNTAPRQAIPLSIPGYFLTTFEATDASALHALLTIRSVTNCLVLVPEPFLLSEASRWISTILLSQTHLLSLPTISQRHAAFFAQSNPLPLQVIRYEGKLVGAISHAPRAKAGDVEMGYYLHPEHQGKGVVQAAGRALLRYAANEFGIRKVFASADVWNVASGKIIEKLTRETAVGGVVKGEIMLEWPVEKKVSRREVKSPSMTWSWEIKADEGYEFARDF